MLYPSTQWKKWQILSQCYYAHLWYQNHSQRWYQKEPIIHICLCTCTHIHTYIFQYIFHVTSQNSPSQGIKLSFIFLFQCPNLCQLIVTYNDYSVFEVIRHISLLQINFLVNYSSRVNKKFCVLTIKKTLKFPTLWLLSKCTMGFQTDSHEETFCLFCHAFSIILKMSESLKTLGSVKITPNFEFSKCSWEAHFMYNCKCFVKELQNGMSWRIKYIPFWKTKNFLVLFRFCLRRLINLCQWWKLIGSVEWL